MVDWKALTCRDCGLLLSTRTIRSAKALTSCKSMHSVDNEATIYQHFCTTTRLA